MSLVTLTQVHSLNQLLLSAQCAAGLTPLEALQSQHPEVRISATPKAVTVRGAAGACRLVYPFSNDRFYIAALELRCVRVPKASLL